MSIAFSWHCAIRQLKDGDIREEFYQKIINSLDLGDSNYLILLAHDSYDVPP